MPMNFTEGAIPPYTVTVERKHLGDTAYLYRRAK